MSEWEQVRLGEVTTQIREAVKVVPGVSYDLLGLRMRGGGVYRRETVDSTTSKAKTLYRASAGQFIYNRMFAWGGSFGVVPSEMDDSFVSNEFPLFECDAQRLLSAYLELHFQQPDVWAEVERASAGTTASRNRWKEALFSDYRLHLPPLTEQRRIVDLVASVDAQIGALAAEREMGATLLDAILREHLASLDSTVTLGSLATIRSGPSWSASDERKTSAMGGHRVLKITNTRPDGRIDMSDETYVDGLPSATPVLDQKSIVLVRTNGNRQRIGNAYLPIPEALGCVVSAFQFILKVTDPSVRDFVFWALRNPVMQGRMSEAASGSTGLGNLAAGWLKGAQIPWTESDEARARLVTHFAATSQVVEGLASELAALRATRNGLVRALLSGDVTVTQTYDDLLEAAS